MNKPTLISFAIGLILGSLIVSTFLESEKTKLLLDIVQTLVITMATIFTAWWTSKTFASTSRADDSRRVIEAFDALQEAMYQYVYTKPMLMEALAKTKKDEYLEYAIDTDTQLNKALDRAELAVKQCMYLRDDIRLNLFQACALRKEDVTEVTISTLNKKINDSIYLVITTTNFDLDSEIGKIKRYFGF